MNIDELCYASNRINVVNCINYKKDVESRQNAGIIVFSILGSILGIALIFLLCCWIHYKIIIYKMNRKNNSMDQSNLEIDKIESGGISYTDIE